MQKHVSNRKQGSSRRLRSSQPRGWATAAGADLKTGSGIRLPGASPVKTSAISQAQQDKELDCKAANLEDILKEKGECGVSSAMIISILSFDLITNMAEVCNRILLY